MNVSLQPNKSRGLHEILLNWRHLKQWMGSLEIQKQSDNLVGDVLVATKTYGPIRKITPPKRSCKGHHKEYQSQNMTDVNISRDLEVNVLQGCTHLLCCSACPSFCYFPGSVNHQSVRLPGNAYIDDLLGCYPLFDP